MPKVHRRKAASPGESPARAGERRVLEAATRLFIRAGGTAFTARGVAKEARLSLGAVQHFFRTRDQLLAAMLTHVQAQYARAFARVEARLPGDGGKRLLGVIDFLVDDAGRPKTRKFFCNLYALGCHQPFAARLVSDMTAHHRQRLAGYIAAARPTLSARQRASLALPVAALIEGLMLVGGARGKPARAQLRDAVLRLIDQPRSRSPLGS